MKTLLLIFIIFISQIAVGADKFKDMGCENFFGSFIAKKYNDKEYDAVLYPTDEMGDGPLVILYTKTSIFTSAGQITDTLIAKHKGTKKVKMDNGFTEIWDVWEESAECKKLFKGI